MIAKGNEMLFSSNNDDVLAEGAGNEGGLDEELGAEDLGIEELPL